MKRPSLSRRALLALGAGASVAPLSRLSWTDTVTLVSHASAEPQLPLLRDALETSFLAAGRPTRVDLRVAARHAELQRIAGEVRGDVLVLDGAARLPLWQQELSSSSKVHLLSFGASVESDEVVAAPLWQSVSLGTRWAAQQWGARFAVLTDGAHACTDLPFVAQVALSASGATLHGTRVVQPDEVTDAWRSVAHLDGVIVLGQALLEAQPVGTRALSIAPGPRAHHVAPLSASWHRALADRAVASLLGRAATTPPLAVHAPGGSNVLLGAAETVAPPLHPLTLRNRSSHPFIAC